MVRLVQVRLLFCIALHCIVLCCNALYYIVLYCVALCFIAFYCVVLQLTTAAGARGAPGPSATIALHCISVY